jgi:hypothetical protein
MQSIYISELSIFDMLRNKFKLPEKEAREVAVEISRYNEALAAQVDKEVDKHKDYLAAKKDLEILRAEIQSEIKETKVDLIKWMVSLFIGFFIALVGTLVTILKFVL